MNILEAAETIRQKVEQGGWKYYNSKLSGTFNAAVKNKNYRINCACGVYWACKMIGDLSSGGFYGNKGKVAWTGTAKAQMEKAGWKLIHINGKQTVNAAIKDGTLQAGDIVFYQDLVHTNLYAGKKKWYDFGSAYNGSHGNGLAMKQVYGKTVYGSYAISYLLRKVKTYRVRIGIYNDQKVMDTTAQLITDKTGLNTFTEKNKDGSQSLYCGSFSVEANAAQRVSILNGIGLKPIIIEV